MGKVNISQSGGGGITSDDVTVIKAHVLKGETALTSDSNDEVVNGEMEVNSLLSFSVAAYSGRRVLAKWQNPKAAKGKPYSGVYIRYSTSGYPGKTGGTQIYKGAGNNTSSEGQSQAYLDLPALNTTYYLSCIPYVTCSSGEITGTPLNATIKTSGQITKVITATQNYTIPSGYSILDIFCVGGGGAGHYGRYTGGTTSGYYYYPGGGGGGGYTKTVKNISVSSGQVLACTVGAGGAAQTTDVNTKAPNGGTTSVYRNGIALCSAAGGNGAGDGTMDNVRIGGNGGSGGGRGAIGGNRELTNSEREETKAGNGGSNGSNGYKGTGGNLIYTGINQNPGTGQGTTTRPFGESTGTLYGPGGGGGAGGAYTYVAAIGGYAAVEPGTGGDTGGGKGGSFKYDANKGITHSPVPGAGGSPNTGAGGGGGSAGNSPVAEPSRSSGAGGSGIIIFRLR